MDISIIPLGDFDMLAGLIALKPMSYVIRLGIAALAFVAAMDGDRVLARVVGLACLVITGFSLFWVGIQNETVIDILLGLGALAAAGYSWWNTHA